MKRNTFLNKFTPPPAQVQSLFTKTLLLFKLLGTKFKWLWLLMLFMGILAGCIKDINKTDTNN